MLSFEASTPRIVGEKYVLVELLGLGSMGEVWIAQHAGLAQRCAVKLLARETHEAAETVVVRFQREARLAAALSRKTRHIVAVTDYGVDAHGPYLVMELLVGAAFDAHIANGCAPREVVEIVDQIAKGLAVAHREGVIHRDLKPANVFLGRDEDGALLVKLLDFGIARMTSSATQQLTMKGVIVGTPGYMSPEHVFGEELDARADVWSLAIVAFEALTGALPFESDTVEGTLQRISLLDHQPLRSVYPNASLALEAVFTRAFAPDIADRFQSANDFSVALSTALSPATRTEAVLSAPSPVPATRSWKPAFLLGGAIAMAISAGAYFFSRPPSPEAHVVTVQTIASPLTTTTTSTPAAASTTRTLDTRPEPSIATTRPPRAPSALFTPSALPAPSVVAAPPPPTVDRSAIF